MTPGRSKPMRVLGMMSGTSADGIDVALVRFGRSHRELPLLEGFTTLPWPARVRAAILRVAGGALTTSAELSRLNFLVGEYFARAADAACRRFGVSPRQIHLIGSHDQTVFHQGAASRFLHMRVASTLQIGEPAVIAERTGISTVGDFRVADVAAGGQGAPLVPYVDYLLYRHPRRTRIALNIGGIANVTVIRAGARPEDVFAFDTGPGNMVVDALVRHFAAGLKGQRYTPGRASFDRNAHIARRGRTLTHLLDTLLEDEYFRLPPPKTAGREQFGEVYMRGVLAWGKKHHAQPADLMRTATLLTPLSIVDAFHRFVSPRLARARSPIDLIVSGGGAHNPLMMAQLAAALPNVDIRPSSEFGVPVDAKEAYAFAILAYEAFHRRPANLPGATGARHPVLLGKICYAHR